MSFLFPASLSRRPACPQRSLILSETQHDLSPRFHPLRSFPVLFFLIFSVFFSAALTNWSSQSIFHLVCFWSQPRAFILKPSLHRSLFLYLIHTFFHSLIHSLSEFIRSCAAGQPCVHLWPYEFSTSCLRQRDDVACCCWFLECSLCTVVSRGVADVSGWKKKQILISFRVSCC